MATLKHINSKNADYQLFSTANSAAPEDRMTIGRIFDLGHPTDKVVELNNRMDQKKGNNSGLRHITVLEEAHDGQAPDEEE